MVKTAPISNNICIIHRLFIYRYVFLNEKKTNNRFVRISNFRSISESNVDVFELLKCIALNYFKVGLRRICINKLSVRRNCECLINHDSFSLLFFKFYNNVSKEANYMSINWMRIDNQLQKIIKIFWNEIDRNNGFNNEGVVRFF
jgi:hypothetical protein